LVGGVLVPHTYKWDLESGFRSGSSSSPLKKKKKENFILVSVLKIRHNPSSVWFVITTWIGTGG